MTYSAEDYERELKAMVYESPDGIVCTALRIAANVEREGYLEETIAIWWDVDPSMARIKNEAARIRKALSKGSSE